MSNKKSGKKKIYTRYTYNLGDGAKVIYIPRYVNLPDNLFNELKNSIPWDQYKYQVHGKEVMSPRLMHIINYGDNQNEYIYLPELEKIKKRVERIIGRKFSYAVLNYYRDGKDYIGFHSDREVKTGQIVVSVTVGATRKFVLKHKFREDIKHVFLLEDGDVLILNEAAIKGVYKHSIPKMANVGSRINITFRE